MYINKRQEKINILYIIDTLCGEGGTENHLYYLVKNLDRNKFNCSIVSFNIWGSFIEKIRSTGIQVYHVPVARYYTPSALLKCFELRKIIKDNMIDIVQTFHYKSDTYGVITARLSGIHYIISSRRDVGDMKKKVHFFMNRLCNKYIDRFITVCNAVGKRIEVDENVPMSEQTTIYNGVDLEKFSVPDRKYEINERKRLGIDENAFVIGSVANFRPEKNYDIFFKAIGKVKDKINGLKIVVVGDGPTEEHCKRYCRDHGMSDIVNFIGRQNDVRQYIAVMDVACLVPGSNEGFSNSILEKMAMGKPLVVTSVGGNAESVIDGENGIVIPPFDPDKLAESLIYLYINPSKRLEMGQKSRSRVEKLFNIKNMIYNHESFYRSIFDDRKLADRKNGGPKKTELNINILSVYKKRIVLNAKSAGRLAVSVSLYYTGMLMLFRYLKNKNGKNNKIKILAYHDISDKDYLNLQVPSEVFCSHVKYLIEQGYNIIPLREAVKLLEMENNEPIQRNSIVLTFDDVYSSFYKILFPIVKQFKIPVTIFICTESLDNRVPPFVDVLIYAFDNTSKEKIDLTGIGLESYSLNSKLLKEYAIYNINEYSKDINAEDRGSLISYIYEQMGESFPSQELSKEILSWDEIIEMGKDGLVEFGAHTMNHLSLSRVSSEEVRDEIWASKLRIQLKLGKDIQSFAYPYGSVKDISEEVRGIVQDEGLSCGCTLFPGVNRKGDDLYLLKRICVTNQIKPKYLRIFSKAVFAFHMMKF